VIGPDVDVRGHDDGNLWRSEFARHPNWVRLVSKTLFVEDVIGQIALRVLDGDHGLGAGIGDSDGEPEVRVVRIICRVGGACDVADAGSGPSSPKPSPARVAAPLAWRGCDDGRAGVGYIAGAPTRQIMRTTRTSGSPSESPIPAPKPWSPSKTRRAI